MSHAMIPNKAFRCRQSPYAAVYHSRSAEQCNLLLYRQSDRYSLTQVQAALQELIDLDLLVRTERPAAHPIFRVNAQQLQQSHLLLGKTDKA